ncbi:hypothetical protein B0H16DRAFT_1831423 [Mycena metata]|uniref:Uncharacterized protein n=1 Tax=Mycena metata TaxID=1033252 RepID=A0AAD7J2N4_9AGAR|nr:hypothetical protein B0H16DRAFT_1831423 [Mycena metata]
MRLRTLEIRWHDSEPIFSCNFQPVPYAPCVFFANVRAILPGINHKRRRRSPARHASNTSPPSAATLPPLRGDDCMVIIWAPSLIPPVHSAFASSSDADPQLEKEFWKPRTTFRCTTMQAAPSSNSSPALTLSSASPGTLNEYLATQSSDCAMEPSKPTPSAATHASPPPPIPTLTTPIPMTRGGAERTAAHPRCIGTTSLGSVSPHQPCTRTPTS